MNSLYPELKQEIVQYGNTLRLHPQNCLVAHFDKERGHWMCDPDLAVPLAVQLVVKAALAQHELKWSKPDDHKLYHAVTGTSVKKKIECLRQAEIMELFVEGMSHA